MFDAPKAKLQITINRHKAINLHWKTSFRYAFIYDYYFKIFTYGLSDVLIKVICWLVFVCIVRIYIQKFAYSSVLLCLLDGVSGHFQQKFSYIVAVSFIGVGMQSTRRIPQTYRKSLTNSIT